MSDDPTADAFDYIRYAVLEDARLTDPQFRLDALSLVDRAVALADLRLPDDLAVRIDELRAALYGMGLSRTKTFDETIAAFVRFNPELLTVPQIRHRYLKGEPLHKLANLRYAVRAREYGIASVPPPPSRRFHSKAEPIEFTTGQYYSDVFSAGTDLRAGHAYSPWYLFHAWAWGRYWYAEWLDTTQGGMCSFTHHGSAHYRRHNNLDGSGLAWLHCATEFVTRLRGTKTSLVRLPVPAMQVFAHELPDSPFHEPGKTGTSLRVLTLAVNAERHAAGLPPI